MNMDQFAVALHHSVVNQLPLLAWGAPGIGKTDAAAQVAASLDMELSVQCPAQLDAVDTRGLPSIVGDETIWTRPELLPSDGRGILFLDDMNTGAPLVINGLLQLVRGRRLGKYKLGDGWSIIAACNRITDRVHVQRLSSAMANRFTHVTVEPEAKSTVKHAANNKWAPIVVAFLQMRPELIHAFTWQQAEKKRTGTEPELDLSTAFESPRAWEAVSRLVLSNLPKEIEYEMIAGTIGTRAAIEFCGFMTTWRNMPNPNVCLTNPKTAPIPSDTSALFALTGALSHLVTDRSMDRLVTYAERLPPEYAVACMIHTTRRDASLANNPAYITWAAKNQETLY